MQIECIGCRVCRQVGNKGRESRLFALRRSGCVAVANGLCYMHTYIHTKVASCVNREPKSYEILMCKQYFKKVSSGIML